MTQWPMTKFNCWLSVLVWLAGLLLLKASSTFPFEVAIFPRVTIAVGLFCSLMIIVTSFMTEETCKPFQNFPVHRFVFIIILFCLYIGGISTIGFYLMTWLFLLITTNWFKPAKKVFNITFATIFTVVLLAVFNLVLNVPLPKGIMI